MGTLPSRNKSGLLSKHNRPTHTMSLHIISQYIFRTGHDQNKCLNVSVIACFFHTVSPAFRCLACWTGMKYCTWHVQAYLSRDVVVLCARPPRPPIHSHSSPDVDPVGGRICWRRTFLYGKPF